MKRKLVLAVLLVGLLSQAAFSVSTEPWSGILDPSRATDWTKAGIPGGIPSYTTVCQTVSPSGRTDSTDVNAINSAIASCGATAASSGIGQVVQLVAGTYTLTGSVVFNGDPSGFSKPINKVVLRGAGPDKTILKFTGMSCGADFCIKGSDGWTQNYTTFGGGSAAWTGDNGTSGSYKQGDNVIDVGSWSGAAPAVGDVVELDQRDDSIGICPQTGGTGACAGVSGATESGTTVTITTSIPHGYSVGDCVGIGDVGGSESTIDYNSSGNASGSCTSNGVTYTGWFQITAVPSSTTFQYTAPLSGLAANGGGYATKDTGGAFVSGVDGAVIDEESSMGRLCPDSSDPDCAAGEISKRSQTVLELVTAVNGSQLTIDPPFEMTNWRSSQSPGVWWPGGWDFLDGVEDLTFDMTQDGGNDNYGGLTFNDAYESWAKNVRGIDGNRNHVWISNAGRIEVVDSYFFGTKGEYDLSYGVETYGGSNDLVQNNICQHVVACVMNGQDYGSVFAYNYIVDDGYNPPDWMIPTLDSNHDFSGLNLFEGNDADALSADDTHGTAIGNTIFRNRLVGQDTPARSNSQSFLAAQAAAFNRMENFIGNIMGTPQAETDYQNTSAIFPPTPAVYRLGMQGENGHVTEDPLTPESSLRWGNYDVVTGAVRWCGTSSDPNWSDCTNNNVTSNNTTAESEIPTTGFTFVNGNPVPASTTLPASFYLSGQPAFWTTAWGTPPWPAIGPSLACSSASGQDCDTPADAISGYSYYIPAQLCYIHTPVDPAYQQTFTATGASWASGTATLTINNGGANALAADDAVEVSGVSSSGAGSGFNGTFAVVSATSTSISYALSTNPGSYTSGGTITDPNILLFNAATCYPNDFGDPPNPPTSLSATVN